MADISIPKLIFIDLAAREVTAIEALRYDFEKLKARDPKVGLSGADKIEFERLKKLDDARTTAGNQFDALFVALKSKLADPDTGLRPIAVTHDKGVFEFAAGPNNAGALTDSQKASEVTRIALLFGLLQKYAAPTPQLRANSQKVVVVDTRDPNNAPFGEAFFRAVGRVSGRMALAKKSLLFLASAVDGARDKISISALEYARVFERLVEQGVDDFDPNLKRRVEENLDQVQDRAEERPLHEFEISLPDLEATTEFEVVADHCRLMGSFIFASAFEELKAFQVVEKLIELSQSATIPLIRGPAGTQLYNYWREAPNRMSDIERQNFYAMTLGLPTGQPGVAVNSDFQDLWLRFVSSVSSLVRESRVDRLIRSALPIAINQQQVKKAARDLAANMSARGYGMVFYAAADLNKQIDEIIKLLSDKELCAAFGARDMWGVIDQIAQTELGGARNGSKYRMLATSGAIITNWIANHTDRLRDPTLPMIDLGQVESPPARPSGQTAVSRPSDYDLVNACEMWLADSAMGDERVDQMSQPRESPQQTSRPIQIPSIARDLLEGAGLGLGMGLGAQPRGYTNGQAHGYTGY